MGKYFPPLDRSTFDTIHWLVLEYLDEEKDSSREEALQTMTQDILESQITLEQVVSYMLDRMVIEKGVDASNRGNLYLKQEKQFRQELEKVMAETVKQQRETVEETLTQDQHVLMAHSALLLSVYFPLAADLERDNALHYELAQP